MECIIQLPGNLFFGTSIATCIMVLKKSKSENSTLFIDASKECVKVTNNNNLSVSSYVEREDAREKIDIVKLNAEIKEIVAREEKLRAEIDKIIAEEELSGKNRSEIYGVE